VYYTETKAEMKGSVNIKFPNEVRKHQHQVIIQSMILTVSFIKTTVRTHTLTLLSSLLEFTQSEILCTFT